VIVPIRPDLAVAFDQLKVGGIERPFRVEPAGRRYPPPLLAASRTASDSTGTAQFLDT
jgi:hypothetical protein